MADDFSRCVDFMRAYIRNSAGRAVRTAHGTAYFADDLPRVWYLNQLLVDLGTNATRDELIAEAESVQGEARLAHRTISIDHELGGTLAADFRELGWCVEEDLVMTHIGLARRVGIASVEEVSAEELVPVWRREMHTDPNVTDDEGAQQLVEAQLRRRLAVHVRYFATRVDGRIASYCELFSDGRTGQIESVMAGEEFRGRGLGKAVVAGALAASQHVHDVTFIVADANDWPKDLYRKLGFEPVGSTHTFVRRPAPG